METVRRIVGIALCIGLMGFVGCGNDGENDQGVSFRAVGVFQGEVSEGKCTVPTADKAIADAGIAFPLNATSLDLGYPNDGLFFCRGYIWLQNDLHNQSVVVDRIDFSYEVPGSRLSIPSSSFPVGIRINPAKPDPAKEGSAAPQNPFGPENVYIGQLDGQMVPARIIAFLRQNQPSLPALPYVMIVHLTARGRSDSGELMISNEIRYTIEWTG